MILVGLVCISSGDLVESILLSTYSVVITSSFLARTAT
jgi:hypothetical protein